MHVLYKTLNLAICRWTKEIVELFFCLSILAKQDKLTGARQSNYMSHPHVQAKRLHPSWNQQPWSPAQISKMEQAGEMVGQVNGEFYSFNDNTLSYGYICSVADLFLGIDSSLCNLSWKLEERSNLKKWRVFPRKALS